MKSMLPSMAVALLLSHHAMADDAAFEPPVQLTDGVKNFSDMIYPSPVLFDIDGDEQRELILGDLPGNLWFCEPVDSGDDTQWQARRNMQADGKPLKLHNW